jgi:hypothetical protein
VLLLYVTHTCIYFFGAPEDVGVTSNEGKEGFSEGFVGADGTAGICGVQILFEELTHAELLTRQPINLLRGHGQVNRLYSELIRVCRAKLIVVPSRLFQLGQFVLQFKTALKGLLSSPEYQLASEATWFDGHCPLSIA